MRRRSSGGGTRLLAMVVSWFIGCGPSTPEGAPALDGTDQDELTNCHRAIARLPESRLSWAGYVQHACDLLRIDHPLRDAFIYQVMPDRFANGDLANDYGDYAPVEQEDPDSDEAIATHGFKPDSIYYYHGGDLTGLRERLDYIQGLGATAIWTTPVMRNKPVQQVGEGFYVSGHHGFWVTDFLGVDPHLGTSQELRAYTREAQARGMQVIFDILINHTADIFGYAECGGAGCGYVSKADKPYTTLDLATGDRLPFDDQDYAWSYTQGPQFPTLDTDSLPLTPVPVEGFEKARNPAWLNSPLHYHARGGIATSKESELYGDLSSLDDLFTLHPTVLGGLIDIYRYWVEEFGVDAYRIDAVKHVEPEFLAQWWPAVRDHAAKVGKRDFFAFGEVFDPNPKRTGAFPRSGGIPSVLDFPLQRAVERVLSGGGSPEALRRVFMADDEYVGVDSSPYLLPIFLGNHDMGRFGAFLVRDRPEDPTLLTRSMLAHAFLFTARGIPIVYYGDEQGFTGFRAPGDTSFEATRQDMFPSKAAIYQDPILNRQLGAETTPAADNFDPSHPLYRAIASYAELRRSVDELRHGAQLPRFSSTDTGLFAFSRIRKPANREVLVVFNMNATETRTASIRTLHPSTPFEGLWPKAGGAAGLRSDADGRVEVSVPPLSFAVYRAMLPVPSRREAPALRLTSPAQAFGFRDFLVEAALPEETFAKVTFYTREGDARDFTLRGADDAPPYRVRVDAAHLPRGTPIEVRAVVTDHSGNVRVSESKRLVTEDRLPRVTVAYENARARRTYFVVKPTGEATLPAPIPAAGITFEWPEDTDQLTFFFETASGGSVAFDRPVVVRLEEDVIPRAQATPSGLVATVQLPTQPELPVDPKAPPPIEESLFLRGDMNGWGLTDGLKYLGSYTYGGPTTLAKPGRYAFKFADAEWSPNNFGGSFTEDGLTLSATSGPLSIDIPEGAEGEYEVHFFSYPPLEAGAPRYHFFRFSKR